MEVVPGASYAAVVSTSTSIDGNWRFVRRGALVAVLLWAAYMVLFVQPTHCRDAVADTTVVQVCEPVAVSSPAVLVVALVVALLVLPELNELELAGLVTLRRRVAETQTDVAELRAQVVHWQAAAESQALAGSTAGASAQVHVSIGRDHSTAAAIESQQGAPGEPVALPLVPATVVGSAAVVAFRAGLLGLDDVLPSVGVNVALVGFTLAEDGGHLEATHDVFPAPPELLDRADELLNDDWPIEGNMLATAEDGWIVASPAYNDDGEVIGALAAIFTPPPDPGGIEGDPFEELAAAVEVAAAAYARLLIDLLGEQRVAPG